MTVRDDHPAPEDLVDVAEGEPADGAIDEHLARCQSCHDAVARLRSTAAAALDWQPPDVSPLVWQHFPARVRGVIDGAGRAARWWPAWTRRPIVAAGLVVSVVAVVALAVSLERAGPGSEGPRPAPVQRQPGRAPVAELVEPALLGDDEDGAWILVREAGSDLEWDAVVATMSVPPGSAERAVAQLSPEEQAELARLLRAEIDGGM
jgi:hypothetical protein